ncbi:zinc finger (chy type) domain-containing protein [Cyclospora cayetanensis]|uniref:Zinc finger (Chy type) domain-containing protein n=1 Tax=Cyclospora cayetanensis TaxID=88456 RepID=A0A1D3CZR2_9EIME|nr:zinc finger (chy type) domain-containing protein [Cyclospora cayetanensis]
MEEPPPMTKPRGDSAPHSDLQYAVLQTFKGQSLAPHSSLKPSQLSEPTHNMPTLSGGNAGRSERPHRPCGSRPFTRRGTSRSALALAPGEGKLQGHQTPEGLPVGCTDAREHLEQRESAKTAEEHQVLTGRPGLPQLPKEVHIVQRRQQQDQQVAARQHHRGQAPRRLAGGTRRPPFLEKQHRWQPQEGIQQTYTHQRGYVHTRGHCGQQQQDERRDSREESEQRQQQKPRRHQQHGAEGLQQQLQTAPKQQMPHRSRNEYQTPKSSRRACERPQLSRDLPSVVVELQRLRRQFSTSFSLLSCHPLLLPQLQQKPPPQSERASSLLSRTAVQKEVEDSRRLTAAADATMYERNREAALNSSVTAQEASSAAAAPANGESSGYVNAPACSTGVTTECDSLCRFQVLLVPTDPEFDFTALPRGLQLEITVQLDYPGVKDVFSAPLINGQPSVGQGGRDGFAAPEMHLQGGSAVDSSVETTEQGRQAGSDDAFVPREQERVIFTGSPTAALPQGMQSTISTSPVSSGASSDAHGVKGPTTSETLGKARRVAAWVRVCNEDINDCRRQAVESVFSKVIKRQLDMLVMTDLVRTAIKAVDRNIREIFQMDSALLAAALGKADVAWTQQEQKKLEEAVVLYRRVVDPILRWRNISSHVARGLEGPAASKLAVDDDEGSLKRENEDTQPSCEVRQPDDRAQDEDKNVHLGKAGATAVTLRGCDVSLLEPVAEGATSLHLSALRLQVACSRCKSEFDMRVVLPKNGATLEPAGCSADCGKCRLRITVKAQPVIGVTSTALMRVAVVEPIECLLKDLLPCDFVLACDCCGANMKAREVLSGKAHHLANRIVTGYGSTHIARARAALPPVPALSIELHVGGVHTEIYRLWHVQTLQKVVSVAALPMLRQGASVTAMPQTAALASSSVMSVPLPVNC